MDTAQRASGIVSSPSRALGAAAANKKRTETNEAKGKGKMTAAEVIRGDNDVTVTDDGTEAPTATSDIPFPSDKYQADITVPVLDKTLKGKKTLPVRRPGRQRPAVQAVQREGREAA